MSEEEIGKYVFILSDHVMYEGSSVIDVYGDACKARDEKARLEGENKQSDVTYHVVQMPIK